MVRMSRQKAQPKTYPRNFQSTHERQLELPIELIGSHISESYLSSRFCSYAKLFFIFRGLLDLFIVTSFSPNPPQ